MIPADALQVIIICHAEGADAGDFPRPGDYCKTIRHSFVRQDGQELVRHLSLVDEHGTGASVRLFFVDSSDSTKPNVPPLAELDRALHTLVVLIVTDALTRDLSVLGGLDPLVNNIQISNGRHGLIILGMSDEVLSRLRNVAKNSALAPLQGASLERLGEYALRPTYAAILVLSRAHRLLVQEEAHGMGSKSHKACFFISHAKLDGLPLAQTLCHVIDQLPWLDQFYDARDIQSGDDFREILEAGVLGSMLLVLRTDVYDLRPWCRQEVTWAELYDRPVLLVDARTDLFSRASVLGFNGVPGVRIPDGNLVRIVLEALREWVRIGVLRRRFADAVKSNHALDKQTELLSRPPTLISLSEAIKKLRKKAAPGAEVQVVHAEPPLESNHSDAAQDLLRAAFPQGSVVSFKTFCSQMP